MHQPSLICAKFNGEVVRSAYQLIKGVNHEQVHDEETGN